MTTDDHDQPPRDGEILPPNDATADNSDASLTQNYLALVSNYTDRPDLLIAEIEKHDPGFVRRMNQASERDAKELRDERFKFGKIQAYAGLSVSVFAAGAVLFLIGVAVFKELGFWTIIALGLIYAITQGGSAGFMRLIESMSEMLRSKRGGDGKSD